MTLPAQRDKYAQDLARWYKLRDHPVQTALIEDEVRFKVIPAGRRSGKTERAKRYTVREAMRVPGPYFVAAPTRDQVKRVYWNDMKRLSFTSILPKPPSETELTLFCPIPYCRRPLKINVLPDGDGHITLRIS